MPANLGCRIVQHHIAEPAVVDRAVRLALAISHGPLGFGEHCGAARVESIHHELRDLYQEPRYRVRPGCGAGNPGRAPGPQRHTKLEHSGRRYALVSLCIGLGQGIACLIERLD